MRNLALILVCMSLFFTNCKEKPNERGTELSIEQIRALKDNQSLEGKLVEISGYLGKCGHDEIKPDQKCLLTICSDNFCDGEKLIEAFVYVKGNDKIGSFDKKKRNLVIADEQSSSDGFQIITDGNEKIQNARLNFTGKIHYEGNDCYLINVVINK